MTDDEVVIRNYEGKRFTYPLRSHPVPVPVSPVEVAQPASERTCDCRA
jgi:hypothetical protein